jgi:peptidyl-prolyl cis-trans isomerase A (cyclophilin A)/peptidyl-prolyl cis-trans isomerase B (cyclophilin B)
MLRDPSNRDMTMRLMLLILFAVSLTAGAALAGEDSKEKAPVEGKVLVLIKTSLGDLVLELDADKAPVTVENFLSYAEKKAYDGTIFHRVISNFMIQGGGFLPDMNKKPTDAPITNEWKNGLKNKRMSIAMARLGNKPDSATNQFFINVKDNTFLDEPRDGAGYAVFGKVVQGMDVVDKIKNVKTHALPSGYRDVPVEPVIIESVQQIDELPAKDDAEE